MEFSISSSVMACCVVLHRLPVDPSLDGPSNNLVISSACRPKTLSNQSMNKQDFFIEETSISHSLTCDSLLDKQMDDLGTVETETTSSKLRERKTSESSQIVSKQISKSLRKRASSVEWNWSGNESGETSSFPQNKRRKSSLRRNQTPSVDSEWNCGENDLDNSATNLGKESPKHACHLCNKRFTRPWRLRVHLQKHDQQAKPTFTCHVEGCSKSYFLKQHLDRHKSQSHSELVVSSQVACEAEGCRKIFSTACGLKRHMNRFHAEDNLKFQCPLCEEKFSKHKQLRYHMAEHEGEPPLRCDVCSVGAFSDRTLKRHKRTHKIHNCDVPGCDQSFTNYSGFRKHMANHRSCFKSLKCAHCNQVCSTKFSLREHLETHLESRTVFRCPHDSCSRVYFHKRNLDSHIRVRHTKDSTFACNQPDCNMVFYSKKALSKHLNVHKFGLPSSKRKGCRAVRKDAGKPRRAMACKLTGIVLPKEVERNMVLEKSPELFENETDDKNSLRISSTVPGDPSCVVDFSESNVTSVSESIDAMRDCALPGIELEDDSNVCNGLSADLCAQEVVESPLSSESQILYVIPLQGCEVLDEANSESLLKSLEGEAELYTLSEDVLPGDSIIGVSSSICYESTSPETIGKISLIDPALISMVQPLPQDLIKEDPSEMNSIESKPSELEMRHESDKLLAIEENRSCKLFDVSVNDDSSRVSKHSEVTANSSVARMSSDDCIVSASPEIVIETLHNDLQPSFRNLEHVKSSEIVTCKSKARSKNDQQMSNRQDTVCESFTVDKHKGKKVKEAPPSSQNSSTTSQNDPSLSNVLHRPTLKLESVELSERDFMEVRTSRLERGVKTYTEVHAKNSSNSFAGGKGSKRIEYSVTKSPSHNKVNVASVHGDDVEKDPGSIRQASESGLGTSTERPFPSSCDVSTLSELTIRIPQDKKSVSSIVQPSNQNKVIFLEMSETDSTETRAVKQNVQDTKVNTMRTTENKMSELFVDGNESGETVCTPQPNISNCDKKTVASFEGNSGEKNSCCERRISEDALECSIPVRSSKISSVSSSEEPIKREILNEQNVPSILENSVGNLGVLEPSETTCAKIGSWCDQVVGKTENKTLKSICGYQKDKKSRKILNRNLSNSKKDKFLSSIGEGDDDHPPSRTKMISSVKLCTSKHKSKVVGDVSPRYLKNPAFMHGKKSPETNQTAGVNTKTLTKNKIKKIPFTSQKLVKPKVFNPAFAGNVMKMSFSLPLKSGQQKSAKRCLYGPTKDIPEYENSSASEADENHNGSASEDEEPENNHEGNVGGNEDGNDGGEEEEEEDDDDDDIDDFLEDDEEANEDDEDDEGDGLENGNNGNPGHVNEVNDNNNNGHGNSDSIDSHDSGRQLNGGLSCRTQIVGSCSESGVEKALKLRLCEDLCDSDPGHSSSSDDKLVIVTDEHEKEEKCLSSRITSKVVKEPLFNSCKKSNKLVTAIGGPSARGKPLLNSILNDKCNNIPKSQNCLKSVDEHNENLDKELRKKSKRRKTRKVKTASQCITSDSSDNEPLSVWVGRLNTNHRNSECNKSQLNQHNDSNSRDCNRPVGGLKKRKQSAQSGADWAIEPKSELVGSSETEFSTDFEPQKRKKLKVRLDSSSEADSGKPECSTKFDVAIKDESSESDFQLCSGTKFNFSDDSDDPKDPTWEPKREDNDDSDVEKSVHNFVGIYDAGSSESLKFQMSPPLQSQDPLQISSQDEDKSKETFLKPGRSGCSQLSESAWIGVLRQVSKSWKLPSSVMAD